MEAKEVHMRIEGGRKLSGSVTTSTSKNGAVGLLCASMLNDATTTLHKVPKIEEVNRIIEVMESIGYAIKWNDSSLIITPPKKIDVGRINTESAMQTRSIVMFIGPLIHHEHTFQLPQSGGCKLGTRTVRPHFYALEKLGVDIKTTKESYQIHTKGLHADALVLLESGDTVTENVLMCASHIDGTTTIKFASANYQVQELCFFLESLGITIEGIGTTTLVVHGKKKIDTPIEYTLSEDPIDSMFFISAGIMTDSTLTVTRIPIDFLELELFVLEKMGLNYEKSEIYFSENEKTKLVDITIHHSTLSAIPDKIHARPYPGLNMDNLPFFAAIATKAKGVTLIHDWVYEKRAIYYTELDRFGADTVLADPHRFYVTGPTQLIGAELMTPPALRAAALLLVAMLGAKGTSTLRNVYMIKRGYENLVERLNEIGAKVSTLGK